MNQFFLSLSQARLELDLYLVCLERGGYDVEMEPPTGSKERRYHLKIVKAVPACVFSYKFSNICGNC